ncbi:aspartate/glutamate racemase family protein [Photorhabdus tasmaniensis]|uniref:Hydrogenase expression protein HupH n=1 Tax=Photorhabdus tasmaniensis TaxID=1004159 RepID=A0ABX0GGQ0_9GAMM|nr:aspartate/glutamate racemase family protein [Photorhabdus tasmaniensis]NHB87395.1 hydrogenase expression protein HupH [Photorhabdus tasmaniensis]
MRIKVIVPLLTSKYNSAIQEELTPYVAPDVSVTVVNLASGSPSIESRYDEIYSTPEIVSKIVKSEEEGYDGVFVSCVSDPAISVARELVDIPIVGGFEPAALSAGMISKCWGIITITQSCARLIRDLATLAGIHQQLACIRSMNQPIDELHQVPGKLEEVLLAQIKKMVSEDRVTAIVLGCTGMMGMAKYLSKEMEAIGTPIQVIDPSAVALGYLQMMIRAGLTHSRLEYPKLNLRERVISCIK